MDYELSTIVQQNTANWMYSGQDNRCLDVIANAEFAGASEQRCIRVVLLCEDMCETVMPFLSNTGRLRGTVPTYGCKYFPIYCCNQPIETINRLLQMMRLNGTTEETINKVNAYISYLLYLDEIATGNTVQLDLALIYKYSTVSSVERAIAELFSQRKISNYERLQMVERYSEVKNAGPLLENFLSMLNNTFFLSSNRSRRISILRPGDCICFVVKSTMSQPQIEQLFQLISWDILDASNNGIRLSVSIFEGKHKYGKELTDLINRIVGSVKITFYARDFYAGHSNEWQDEMGSYFDAWIFSSHASMNSCESISNAFGSMPVVRSSYSCDRDRRLASNRLIDRLFNTNRVDHYVEHVPAWEPRFRKEEIHAMPPGVCLVKSNGEGYWVQL